MDGLHVGWWLDRGNRWKVKVCVCEGNRVFVIWIFSRLFHHSASSTTSSKELKTALKIVFRDFFVIQYDFYLQVIFISLLPSVLLRLFSQRDSKMMLHLSSLLCVGLHAREQVIYSRRWPAHFLMTVEYILTPNICGLDPLQDHWWHLRLLHTDILSRIMWFLLFCINNNLINNWFGKGTALFSCSWLLPELFVDLSSKVLSNVAESSERSWGPVSLWLTLSSAIQWSL